MFSSVSAEFRNDFSVYVWNERLDIINVWMRRERIGIFFWDTTTRGGGHILDITQVRSRESTAHSNGSRKETREQIVVEISFFYMAGRWCESLWFAISIRSFGGLGRVTNCLYRTRKRKIVEIAIFTVLMKWKWYMAMGCSRFNAGALEREYERERQREVIIQCIYATARIA